MKVGVLSHLFPTKRYPHSGIFVRDTVDRLAGHLDIEVISPLPNFAWFGEVHSWHNSRGYDIKRPFVLAFPRFFYQQLYPSSMAVAISRHIEDGIRKWDLVHAHAAFPDGVAAVKAVRGRKPVILTVHGSGINYFAHRPHLREDILHALHSVDAIVCVSADLQRSIAGMGIDTVTKVIPNGVDTTIFRPIPRNEACIRTGLSNDRPRIIYIGNIVPVKGIPYLIEAMKVVSREVPDCELVMVGGAYQKNLLDEYSRMIVDAGLEKTVSMKMRLPHEELPWWICSSDVLVLPSLKEGFGLVVAEALSCGRPVVATRCGGPEDIIRDGEGYLVPVKDSSELAAALIDSLREGQFLSPDQLAQNAYSRYSFDSVVKDIIELYEQVAGS